MLLESDLSAKTWRKDMGKFAEHRQTRLAHEDPSRPSWPHEIHHPRHLAGGYPGGDRGPFRGRSGKDGARLRRSRRHPRRSLADDPLGLRLRRCALARVRGRPQSGRRLSQTPGLEGKRPDQKLHQGFADIDHEPLRGERDRARAVLPCPRPPARRRAGPRSRRHRHHDAAAVGKDRRTDRDGG